VKFYFTNEKLIPGGIKLVPRAEKLIELKHIRQGGVEAMEKFRKGRVDTASKCEKFRNIDLKNIWENLSQNFKISDIHIFFQQRSNGMKKNVIVVTFQKTDNRRRVKKSLIDEIQKNFVYHGTWGLIYYWENPNGVNTLNCLKRQPRTN